MRIWYQCGDYILTYWVFWVLPLISSSYLIITEATKMYAHIPELEITVGIAFVAVLFILGMVQYSRFIEHRKAHKDDELGKEKFAFVPYLAIPILGAVVSVLVGAYLTDLCVVKEYITTTESIQFWVAVSSVLVYAIADHYLIGHIGDAVYYQTIESKVAEAATKSTDISNDPEALKQLIKQLLK